MNVNTNVPAWSCPYCEMRQESRWHLEDHLGNAHDIKPSMKVREQKWDKEEKWLRDAGYESLEDYIFDMKSMEDAWGDEPDVWGTFPFDEPKSPVIKKDEQRNLFRLQNPVFEHIFRGIFDEAFDLLIERQHKYGPENIEGQGIYGVFTRMRDDKMSRLARSMQGTVHNGVVTVDISGNVDDADTFEDACLDIANYALIMLALYRGLWGAPLEEEYDDQ